MASEAGIRKARDTFPEGFAAIDRRLFDPVMFVLSDAVLRVYLAVIQHCRGRLLRTTTRELGAIAHIDQARVSVALHKLEDLRLVDRRRTARGTLAASVHKAHSTLASSSARLAARRADPFFQAETPQLLLSRQA